jgi:hypothetical protein
LPSKVFFSRQISWINGSVTAELSKRLEHFFRPVTQRCERLNRHLKRRQRRGAFLSQSFQKMFDLAGCSMRVSEARKASSLQRHVPAPQHSSG